MSMSVRWEGMYLTRDQNTNIRSWHSVRTRPVPYIDLFISLISTVDLKKVSTFIVHRHNCAVQGLSCINTVGSYKCDCAEGRLLSTVQNRCVDVNECNEQPRICNPGQCQNTDGGYACICPVGYLPSDNQKSCQGWCVVYLLSWYLFVIL